MLFCPQCWEYAIKLCKELANQYEKETFDFIQLSQILVRRWIFHHLNRENVFFSSLSPKF